MNKPLTEIVRLPTFTGNIPDTAFFSINQRDATGKLGWRTVKTNIGQMYAQNKTYFTGKNFIDNLNLRFDGGLTGKGTTAEPLKIDSNFTDNHLLMAEALNISQIGDIWDFEVDAKGKYHWGNHATSDNSYRRSKLFAYGVSPTRGPLLDRYVVFYSFNIFMAGKQFTVQSTPNGNDGLPLDTEDLEPNKTVYLYIEVVNGELRFFITTNKYAESYTLTCAGVWAFTTTQTIIYGPQIFPYIRIDTYRLSQIPVGSAIPVSLGNPFNKLYTEWE